MNRFILFFICILPAYIQAQTIYPIPQSITKSSEILYVGIRSNAEQFSPYFSKQGLSVQESKLKTIDPEGYTIGIDNKKIVIKYSTERGKFYAYKSLLQILEEAKNTGILPLLKIEDHPDLAFRGTVEGFYGKPWSHEDRISQLRFYGDWKLNTYIYGPKDDPYHSSPKWREAYPSDEAQRLKELVTIAKQNQVDFYWAIHPGLDIKWNRADSTAVLNKFQMMYDLGVRHFAVFFDDISGGGTKAEKQAGLLNYLQKEFVDKKKDVGALIMCPTEYNKGWSNPKEGTYLDILGDKLDPRIHVMWTGNTVIHDITLEGQQWVNKRIKRPSFVWWNFPVSDYVRNHLLLGESYGLDQNAKSEMSGFVSNPMDKPEASKIAIFSIANYSWNLKAYDPTKTWVQAIELLYSEMESSYKLFSSHNTDPGPSYHQYRREESVSIAPILQNQLIALQEGKAVNLTAEEITLLNKEFAQFESSANSILSSTEHTVLVSEIAPWLRYFALQGKAALILLNMNQSADLNTLFSEFNTLQYLKDQMFVIDQTENRSPYQPGIVTASRHVLPWLEQSYLHYQKILKDAGYAVKESANQPKASIYTNIAMLKGLPIQQDIFNGNRTFQVLKLAKMLEFIPFATNEYIGMEVTSNSKIRDVKYKLDRKVDGFVIQYSSDANNWEAKKATDSKYVRLINTIDTTESVKILQFEIVFE